MLFLTVLILTASWANAQISPSVCGIRPLISPLESSKVISGFKAIPGDWGWSISLTNSGRHFCGGVLIDSTTVLTAAHCFGGSSLINPGFRIDIGVHNRNFKESWVQTRSISKLYIHERFSMQNLQNDIALIKLSAPVTLDGMYAIPVCIDETFDPALDHQGKIGWLTGWGHERYQGVLTVEKMQGFISILTDNRCKQIYGTLYDSSVQICAGENNANAGACQGDSGGPFVIQSPSDGRWYLVGLISWGYSCGMGTVFARVSAFLPWIKARL